MMKSLRYMFVTFSLTTLIGCGVPITTTNTSNTTDAPATTLGSLRISGAWVRATSMDGQDHNASSHTNHNNAAPTTASETDNDMSNLVMGAAYMVISNSGAADKLIAGSSNVAKAVE